MTKRGKKSRVIIAGHTLTYAELAVLNQLRHFPMDTATPALDLHEVFPDSRGKRMAARHLAEVGVLKEFSITLKETPHL